MLLHANDLESIIGDQVDSVQHILIRLEQFCTIKKGFSVNLTCTKAMVHRDGGVNKMTEKLCFDTELRW